MLKLITVDSEFFHDEPTITILDVGKAGGMVKSAADSRINEYVSTITPSPDKVYVHILAMGAGEYFGSNRNGDYFPEKNLIACHETFSTSPAHIFKHHINKDPSIAMGQVVYSIYNERMHRVEVIAWIDRVKGREIILKLDQGQFPATSMACHTPFDTCSICGNKARSRNEYCVHLKTELGKIYPDGRRVMAINDGPLRFFDMSSVFKPADVTSSMLQKVASTDGPVALEFEDSINTVGSAEMAERYGLNEKKASFRKISELIKEIEGTVAGHIPALSALSERVSDPDEETLQYLAGHDLSEVIHALAELNISPSVGFFARLIGRKISGEDVSGVETLVKGAIQGNPDGIEIPADFFNHSAQLRPSLLAVLSPLAKQASLSYDNILHRGFAGGASPIYTSQVGNVGLGPRIEPSPAELYDAFRRGQEEERSQRNSANGEKESLLSTLLKIAGMAISAKWILSKMIDEKLAARDHNSMRSGNSPVKIVLVKSAEETSISARMSKYSLLKSLQGLD